MRLRLWISFAAVVLIAAGSVVVGLVVYNRDDTDFHRMQREEASRAAHQAESMANFSVGELSNAATFFQVEGDVNRHEFDVVARSLLDEGRLEAAAFIQRVPGAERGRFERRHGIVIREPGGAGHLVRAGPRSAYLPLTYVIARREGSSQRALGYDFAVDPKRDTFLERARDSGEPTATPVVPLLLGGIGINVYRAIYRDGAPTTTVGQRRAALIGYAAGSFRVQDLAAAAVSAVSNADQVQLVLNRETVAGPDEVLEDPARARFKIADRNWLLVVRDADRPGIGLPLLLAVIGIALATLVGVLIFAWSRNERMQELERQASEDPLTGLKNRRRFEEDLNLAMARARRERTTGALVMLDLDYFKQVNDTYGHPAGDRLIVEVADVLRSRTRVSDVLARLGGDEFAVILPRCTVGEARLAAEAIAKAIREHDPEQELVEPVTASVGVAMFGDRPRTNNAAIVSEADSAMYAAKDGGRDGVRVFDRHAVEDDPAGRT
ncbi:MAG: diguanylate cyclase [Solirubrobacterales bacterium]